MERRLKSTARLCVYVFGEKRYIFWLNIDIIVTHHIDVNKLQIYSGCTLISYPNQIDDAAEGKQT